MASSKDFEREFKSLRGDCYESWTKEDLQLAAELGKTLLERNKELEASLKNCYKIIEDKNVEIEYLGKQSTALRKANDDRIRIYEHLEGSILEVERANQKLALDNATARNHIQSLSAYRDSLEARCEELQKALDEATLEKEKFRAMLTNWETSSKKTTRANFVSEASLEESTAENKIVNKVTIQNQVLKSQLSKNQRMIADLEELMHRKTQDITFLEDELCQREAQIDSLKEKLSCLEEVRSKNLCKRCLIENQLRNPEVSLLELEETLGEDNNENNPYRTLAETYESIVKEHWENRSLMKKCSDPDQLNLLTLQDELKFLNLGLNLKKSNEEEEDDDETQHKSDRKKEQENSGKSKMFPAGASDFSEAESSSSGFSDETSTKSTQTEGSLIPGSFLCSIADGDDCKFSIYDDACPIESRFKKIPEYRTLFREIFAVLKRAAEAKGNDEQLPLLHDLTPVAEETKVPPVTPAKEELPSLEDVQSIPESTAASEDSSTVSETKDLNEAAVVKETPGPSGRGTRPTNDILEYISIGISVKKKPRRRSNNSPAKRISVSELVDNLESSLPNSPRKSGGRRRKEWRSYDSPRSNSRNQSPAIQPHVLTTLERKETPDNRNKITSTWSYQPFVSTAAQDVAKLKKIDKTYAEVLRHTPTFSRPKGVRLSS